MQSREPRPHTICNAYLSTNFKNNSLLKQYNNNPSHYSKVVLQEPLVCSSISAFISSDFHRTDLQIVPACTISSNRAIAAASGPGASGGGTTGAGPEHAHMQRMSSVMCPSWEG
jgi:hypothetical protein